MNTFERSCELERFSSLFLLSKLHTLRTNMSFDHKVFLPTRATRKNTKMCHRFSLWKHKLEQERNKRAYCNEYSRMIIGNLGLSMNNLSAIKGALKQRYGKPFDYILTAVGADWCRLELVFKCPYENFMIDNVEIA